MPTKSGFPGKSYVYPPKNNAPVESNPANLIVSEPSVPFW